MTDTRTLEMSCAVENSWLVCRRRRPEARLRLICLPYAGGGASAFRTWPERLPDWVELWAVQLPGRETRLAEPPVSRMAALLEPLTAAVLPLTDRPFALFGYSLGAAVAYELACSLGRRGREPQRLMVAAAPAPHLPRARRPLHNLPDVELRAELCRLGGTPPGVLENDELMELFLPVLRADFAVRETYFPNDGALLSCPVTAFGGTADDMATEAELRAWGTRTRGGFRLCLVPGGHFFLHDHRGHLLAEIVRDLTEPATGFDLGGDEVHVWRAALNQPDEVVSQLAATLSAEEQSRAARFHFPRDCDRFTVARGVLRDLLAAYLGRAPHEIQFAYHAQGKPYLAGPDAASGLRFNVAHSHQVGLFAVTRGREVGVDVEHIRDDLDVDGIAGRFFSPREVAELESLPADQRRAAFFACWSRKEAYLKARGGGISLGLDQFDVSLRPGEPAVLRATRDDPAEAARWAMQALPAAAGYAAALAVEGGGWRLWCGEWSPARGASDAHAVPAGFNGADG